MAADRASQPDLAPKDCASCRAPLSGRLAPHLCEGCGSPQPLSRDSNNAGPFDPFAWFGVPRRFAQDLAALEKRFYELSRALHPDRFARSPRAGEAQRHSLDRMSQLNRAYSALKNPDERRNALLELEGFGSAQSEQGEESQAQPSGLSTSLLPMEFAEAWFELQDVLHDLSDDNEGARQRIQAFEGELQAARTRLHSEIAGLEAEFDGSGDRSKLQEISRRLKTHNTLASLSRDVERVRGRLAG